MQAERYDEAIPPLQRAVRMCDNNPALDPCGYALFNLGKSLRLAGRPAEAIPYLEQRLQYDNQTPVVQAELDAARRAAGQKGGGKGKEEKGGD
jgi:serine/threonine-protein kinase